MVSISRITAEKVEVAFEKVMFGRANFDYVIVDYDKDECIVFSRFEDDNRDWRMDCTVRYNGITVTIKDCILASINASEDCLLIIGMKSDVHIHIKS